MIELAALAVALFALRRRRRRQAFRRALTRAIANGAAT